MGLYNKFFYHGMTRKYVVSFGNLFNNIHVIRTDADGKEESREKVPLNYGPKEKYVYRLAQNPELTERFAAKMPRIAYQLMEMKYNSTRKTATNQKIKVIDPDNNSVSMQYSPVPYDFVFDVFVATKTTEEGLQIVEQILPFFTPDYTMTIDAIPEFDVKLDIPIVCNSIMLADNWDEGFEKRRQLMWEMTFTLQGFLFQPTREANVITQAEWSIDGFDDEHYASGIETER